MVITLIIELKSQQIKEEAKSFVESEFEGWTIPPTYFENYITYH